MTASHVIPRDKHDHAALQRAARLSPASLEPHLPGLLGCIQDANWPIAPAAAELVLSCGTAALPHIEAVLEGDDSMWKYWTLEMVVARMPAAARTPLLPLLHRLAEAPGPADRADEVHLAAREVLGLPPP